ncbi:hypothetical protein PvtlMGM2_1896 [Prevotella sp. MGM2]|jgi:hypothetical protein|nr:hypothetical protein PvtlMGM2_1896 [Prevotella sp. MGM2]
MLKAKDNIIPTVEQCAPSILSLHGLKKGRDYTLSNGQIYLKNTAKKNTVIAALRRVCPEKHYYWETPHLLRWF